MSESSRKRSRKSKLVPRQCTEIEDENVTNLQIIPKNCYPSLKNETNVKTNDSNTNDIKNDFYFKGIKTCSNDDFEALIDSQRRLESPTPRREFSITVAVEKFDENSSDLMIVEPKDEPLEVVSSDSESNGASKFIQKCTKRKSTKKPDNMGYVLDRDTILDITSKVLEESSDLVDKILGIEVRNAMGRFLSYDKEPIVNVLIENILTQWFEAQKQICPKFRSSPLFYKCYICEMSWWYLHDFREHLKSHEEFQLHLEEYTLYEVNVVATADDGNVEIKHFQTDGDCPKCGYEYARHKSCISKKRSLYICKLESCRKEFHTCFLLRHHEYTAHTISELNGTIFSNSSWRKSCEMCGFIFHLQQSYQGHMDLMHNVRSDVVVPSTYYKICQTCKVKYHYGWHNCMKKKVIKRCTSCNISFSNNAYDVHSSLNKKEVTCRVCNVALPKRCVEIEHLMKHTKKFVLMKKCILCEEFTLISNSKKNALDHGFFRHGFNKDGKIFLFLHVLPVPKACLGLRKVMPTNKLSPTSDPQIEETPIPDAIGAPLLEIKREILEDFENNIETNPDEEDEIKIKEEMEIHDDFEASTKEQYKIKIEANTDDHSRIFGIKIEACEIETKQEIEDEEYEDDIIRLDANFIERMQESLAEESMQESSDMLETSDLLEASDLQETKSKQPKMYRCHKCGFYGLHREFRTHLKLDCYQKIYENGTYTCTKCFSTFDMFQQYVEHLSNHKLSPLCCPECYRDFSSYQVLLPHISMHIRMSYVTVPIITECKKTAQYEYQCKICRDKVDKSEFFKHWETHLTFIENKRSKDSMEDVDEDSDSGVNMVDQQLIKQLIHLLQSPEVTYIKRGCLICHRHFVRRNDCKRHLIEHLLTDAYSHRPQNNALKCQICQKSFQKADKYKKHMRDHASLPEYRCEICDKSFSDSSNFTKHKKLHNLNAYTCDTCGKKFQAKISLEKHIVIHKNQVPIVCNPCNKTFYLSSAYKKHYRMQHEKNAKKFSCVICNIKFKCLKEKWDHMWFIHKERKHKADCTKCNKSYRRFRDLKMHMKTDHLTDLRYYKIQTQNTNNTLPQVIKTNVITTIDNPSETLGDAEETLVVFE